jgi:hypothetical protein
VSGRPPSTRVHYRPPQGPFAAGWVAQSSSLPEVGPVASMSASASASLPVWSTLQKRRCGQSGTAEPWSVKPGTPRTAVDAEIRSASPPGRAFIGCGLPARFAVIVDVACGIAPSTASRCGGVASGHRTNTWMSVQLGRPRAASRTREDHGHLTPATTRFRAVVAQPKDSTMTSSRTTRVLLAVIVATALTTGSAVGAQADPSPPPTFPSSGRTPLHRPGRRLCAT